MKNNTIILLLISTLITGCSQFYAYTSDLNNTIDDWLAINEYGKIDDTLKHLTETHKDYRKIKARLPAINKRKTTFINKTISKAIKLKKSAKWQEALDTYKNALEKVPGNKKLTDELNSLITERDIRINELKKNMLIQKARALIQYEPIYKKLNELIPDDYSASNEIEEYNIDRKQLAIHLMSCGDYALTINDYFLAEECLALSHKLDKNNDKQKRLKQAIEKRKTLDIKRKSKQLLNAYNAAYSKKDYHSAHYNLDLLLSLKPNDKKILALKDKLEKEIAFLLKHDINQGKTLYSKGKVTQALELWENLLIIDPSNEELIALITRARKVSQKLEKLGKH